MKVRKVYSHFVRPDDKTMSLEFNDGKSLVEQGGYVSNAVKINSLLGAGVALQNARSSQFDFKDGEDDERAFDPTRSSNFDLADVSALMRQATENMKRAVRRNDESEKLKKTAEIKSDENVSTKIDKQQSSKVDD